jgi:hypothetical protein
VTSTPRQTVAQSLALPRRVVVVMLIMAVLTTLPYVIGALSAPAGTTFSGAVIDLTDYDSHLAKMQQGARGEWLYQLLFTAEPQQPALLQTFYVALGHVASLTGLPFGVIYQVARIACVMLMVWALWAFMSHFLPVNTAWWALLLSLFAGGIGYLLLFIAPSMTASVSPIEFWLLDAYTFLAAFVSPHLAAGIALLALTFLALDLWTTSAAPLSLFVLFLTALAIGMVQPFDLLLVDVVITIATLWRAVQGRIGWFHALAGLVLIGICHAALVGYDWIVLYHWPVWISFTAQNVTLSPPPIYYLLGYAPTLIPALGGIFLVVRRRDGRWLVPVLWLVGVAALVYAPGAERRYVLGVQAPLGALAVYWLATAAVPWLRGRFKRQYRLVLVLYGAVTGFSTLAVILWLCASARNPTNPDLWVPNASRAGWQWIADNVPTDSVLLADFANGGGIAARTGRRVVLGHWIETADYPLKLAMVQQFFSADAGEATRANILQNQRVSYVWYSAGEKSLGDWNPASADYLHIVYQNSGVTIYAVTP